MSEELRMYISEELRMYITVINQSMGDKHGLGIRVLSWVQRWSPGLRTRASSMLVVIEMDPHLICRGRLRYRAPFSGSILGLHGEIRDGHRSPGSIFGLQVDYQSWAPCLGSVSGSMAIPTGSVLGLHWLGAASKS